MVTNLNVAATSVPRVWHVFLVIVPNIATKVEKLCPGEPSSSVCVPPSFAPLASAARAQPRRVSSWPKSPYPQTTTHATSRAYATQRNTPARTAGYAPAPDPPCGGESRTFKSTVLIVRNARPTFANNRSTAVFRFKGCERFRQGSRWFLTLIFGFSVLL